ncbi:MAG: topoisomerase C-terminal repeat-containing protein, partial [Pikeienuella sp.]
EDRVMGRNEAGEEVWLKSGRFGPYVQLGEQEPDSKAKPKRASLPKGLAPEALTLERALELLSLPRLVGVHPEDGEPIEAAIGRFGPYVRCAKTYANLKDPDDVFTIGMNRAVELIALKRANPGRGRTAAAPLRELGEHPSGGRIALMEGRYGPYVKWEKVNATIPRDSDPATLTLETALELIAAKAGKSGKAPKKKAASKAKKAPAKAKTAKKPTRKKAGGDDAVVE